MTDASLRAGTNTSAFGICRFLRYSIYPRFASHANFFALSLLSRLFSVSQGADFAIARPVIAPLVSTRT
ncbi:putative serine/threonine-protein kinase iksA [Fusarium oxysporum f. sp. albedinis]|nr:putative serine/threonine-protein kinase iksA [Fusarium oxysporum f. sp. albedinis]